MYVHLMKEGEKYIPNAIGYYFVIGSRENAHPSLVSK